MTQDIQDVLGRIENQLWDIISEFHFRLKHIEKWSEATNVDLYRLQKLREHLQEMVLTIFINANLQREENNE